MIQANRRIAVALAIGVGCGVVSWASTKVRTMDLQDIDAWWKAARILAGGGDPYRHFWPPLVSPLPFVMALVPFAYLPVTIAGPVFVALSCALLAYAVTRDAWWPLTMFLSGAMLQIVFTAQASAWYTAALYLPSLLWIAVLKPNIGLGLLAYRWSWTAIAIMIVIAAISVAVRPSWPREWLVLARASVYHFSAWRSTGGFVLLATWTKWRRPEARLLGVLSLVPTSPIVYETLPLFVIPKTRGEMMILSALSGMVYALMLPFNMIEPGPYMARARVVIVWLMYVPALVMVLRRPNVREP